MSLFVIVHGAWGSPAETELVAAPLEPAGHIAIIVDQPLALRRAACPPCRPARLADLLVAAG